MNLFLIRTNGAELLFVTRVNSAGQEQAALLAHQLTIGDGDNLQVVSASFAGKNINLGVAFQAAFNPKVWRKVEPDAVPEKLRKQAHQAMTALLNPERNPEETTYSLAYYTTRVNDTMLGQAYMALV